MSLSVNSSDDELLKKALSEDAAMVSFSFGLEINFEMLSLNEETKKIENERRKQQVEEDLRVLNEMRRKKKKTAVDAEDDDEEVNNRTDSSSPPSTTKTKRKSVSSKCKKEGKSTAASTLSKKSFESFESDSNDSESESSNEDSHDDERAPERNAKAVQKDRSSQKRACSLDSSESMHPKKKIACERQKNEVDSSCRYDTCGNDCVAQDNPSIKLPNKKRMIIDDDDEDEDFAKDSANHQHIHSNNSSINHLEGTKNSSCSRNDLIKGNLSNCVEIASSKMDCEQNVETGLEEGDINSSGQPSNSQRMKGNTEITREHREHRENMENRSTIDSSDHSFGSDKSLSHTPSSTESFWICSRCTFSNSTISNSICCEMCGYVLILQ